MSQPITTLALMFTVLTSQLDDRRFKRRDVASKALAQLTPLSLPHIYLAQHSASTEQAMRAKKLMRQYLSDNAYVLALRTLPTNYHKMPWLSINGCYQSSNTYVQQAQSQGKTNVQPDWPAWRFATILWIHDQYVAGRSYYAIVHDLNRMAETEMNWLRNRKN